MLHVVHGFPPECRGGTESLVKTVADAQCARGDDIAVLYGTLEVGDAPVSKVDNSGPLTLYRLIKGGFDIDRWDKSDDLAAAAEIDRILESFAPSVVHVHQWIRLSRFLVRVARSRGIPVVLTLHDATATCPTAFRLRCGSLCDRVPSGASCSGCAPTPPMMRDQELGKALDRYASDLRQEVSAANVVVVPTQAHATFLSSWLPVEVRPIVIPHPPLKIKPSSAVARSPRSEGPLRVVSFGSLSDIKGTPLLYEALRLLSSADRAALRLTVKGEAINSDVRARLDALKQGMPIEETGPYRPDELDGSQFDLAVLPSFASESWSFALDEAWAIGLPVVVPSRGALGERVGTAGFTFDPENANALAGVLSSLIAQRSLILTAREAIPAPTSLVSHLEELDRAYSAASRSRQTYAPLWRDAASDMANRFRDAEQELLNARGRLQGESDRFNDLTTAFHRSEISVTTLRGEVGRLEGIVADYRTSVANHQGENASLKSEIRSLQAERAELADVVRERDRNLREFERSVVEYRELLARKESDLSQFRVSISEHQRVLEAKNDHLEDLRGQAMDASTALREEIARATADHNRTKEQLEQRSEELARVSAAGVIAAREFQSRYEELSVRLNQSEATASALTQELLSLRESSAREAQRVAARAMELVCEVSAVRERLDALTTVAMRHVESIEHLQGRIEASERREASLSKKVTELALRVTQSDGEIQIYEIRVRELARARQLSEEVALHLSFDLGLLRRELSRQELAQGALRRDLESSRTVAVELTSRMLRAEQRWMQSESAHRAALARSAELASDATELSRRVRAMSTGITRELAASESWRRRAMDAEKAAATRAAYAQKIKESQEDLAVKLAEVQLELGLKLDEEARLTALLGSLAPSRASLADAVAQLRAESDGVRAQLSGVFLALSGAKADLPGARRLLGVTDKRLRVLIVVHDFLPYHAAGSEIYTYQLAKALSTHCDVHLLFCENRPDRPQYETRNGVYDGIPFTEVVHHDAFPTFGLTYEDPAMERVFDGVVDSFQPNVVHIQHLKFWGVGIVERARAKNCPVFFTLHEYMLICPRDGQMLRPSGERCDVPVVSTCASCIEGRALEQGWIGRRAIAAGRFLSERLPDGARHLGARVARRVAVRNASAGTQIAREQAISTRLSRTADALRHVETFLAPSQFLRDRFVASGMIPPDRIEWSRYGQEVSRFPHVAKVPSARLRVGYLGTVSAYKGLGVFVEALESLSSFPIEGRIHGALEIFPDYVSYLRETVRNPNIHLMGRFDNKDVARLLAEIDVLVVPSLWWENAPLTIHEAFLARVPVVCSDIGGMRELVTHGKNGLHFVVGDASDLARKLLSLATDQEFLKKLTPDPADIRDIREDAVSMIARYHRALVRRKQHGAS